MQNPLLSRITVNPAICGGKPTIRNMRLTVDRVLNMLAGGMTMQDILGNHPYLKREDLQASLLYAASRLN